MLPLKNNEQKFGWPAQLMHWIMAIVIIGMIVIGLKMVTLPNGPDKLWVYDLHKSTGILILFFVLFRLTWRQFNFQPHVPHENGRGIVYPPRLYRAMDLFAHYWHMAIYIMILIMPITGWLMTSSFGFPVSVFGWFVMPDLVVPNKNNAKLFETIHDWTSYLLIFFIIVHILAGLFHHYILKDIVMKRMLPVLAFVLVGLNANAADKLEKYNIDQVKSSIKFQATQNGAPAVGEFTNYKANITFGTGGALAGSKVEVDIDTNSIKSTYDEMVSTLKGDEWFNVKKYPQAKFQSGKFTYLSGDNYTVDGTLTIRDKTVPVQLKFTLKKPDETHAIVDGETIISRKAFGLGWTDTSAVKDEVKVIIHVDATVTK